MNFIFKENIWVLIMFSIASLGMLEPHSIKHDCSILTNRQVIIEEDTVQSNFIVTEVKSDPNKKCFQAMASEGCTFRWWFDVYMDSLSAKSLSNPFWQSMEEAPCFTYSQVGRYYVALEVTHSNGYSYDTIIKEVSSPTVWIKLSNTLVTGMDSNGNKRVFDLGIEDCSYFHLNIYSRWGTKVFHSETEVNLWDGKLLDTEKDAAEGTYYFNLKYKQFSYADTTEISGTITLINP